MTNIFLRKYVKKTLCWSKKGRRADDTEKVGAEPILKKWEKDDAEPRKVVADLEKVASAVVEKSRKYISSIP